MGRPGAEGGKAGPGRSTRRTALYAAAMVTVTWARSLAGALIGSDARRFAHVRSVAARVDELGSTLLSERPGEHEVVVTAAWLHDMGYSAALVRTGCHHLDGAAHLRSFGEERLASLVAYHSSGAAEAGLRGLEEELSSYEREESLVADLLTFADLTTGPSGGAVSLDERLLDVARRYGTDHVVTRRLLASEAALRASFSRVEAKIAASSTAR